MNTAAIDPIQLENAKVKIASLAASIKTLVVGQDEVIDQVMVAFLAQGHVLLEGVPGLGKTLLIRALAGSVSLDYKRIQFTPDLMPADVTGHSMLDMKTGEFVTRKGPVFTNLLLADEINRAPAKTQAALLEVMQEKQVTIDGSSLAMPSPFMVLATQNPIDNEGTYPLPEAQLDRFIMKVNVSYPALSDEVDLTILNTDASRHLRVSNVVAALSADDVIELQHLAEKILVDQKLVEYAVSLARTTREWQGVDHGAGIRASISLVQTAKVVALTSGRDFVTPDDIKSMVLPVFTHRIILSASREIAGDTPEQVLNEIIASVSVPRQ